MVPRPGRTNHVYIILVCLQSNVYMAGGLANYDGAAQLLSSAEVDAFLPFAILQPAAGTQGQSILATVQPQLLLAIDLLSQF